MNIFHTEYKFPLVFFCNTAALCSDIHQRSSKCRPSWPVCGSGHLLCSCFASRVASSSRFSSTQLHSSFPINIWLTLLHILHSALIPNRSTSFVSLVYQHQSISFNASCFEHLIHLQTAKCPLLRITKGGHSGNPLTSSAKVR